MTTEPEETVEVPKLTAMQMAAFMRAQADETGITEEAQPLRAWADLLFPRESKPETIVNKLRAYLMSTYPDEVSAEAIINIVARAINDLPHEVIAPQVMDIGTPHRAFYRAGALDARDAIVDRLIGLGETP